MTWKDERELCQKYSFKKGIVIILLNEYNCINRSWNYGLEG
jgi:hypothetical protein